MLRVAGEYREDEMAVILDFLKKVTESAEEMSGNMEKAAS
jgi:hypothetical protein